MRHLMISAAVLALLAVPAMAQPEEPGSRGKASVARQGSPAPQAAPAAQPAPAPQAAPQAAPMAQAAPAERGRGDRGGDRGNRGGAQQGAPQQAAPAPQAQPAQPQGQIFDRSGRGQQNQPNAQPGDNRGRDNRFGNGRDNRDWRNNGRDDRRGDRWRNDNRGNGFGNRPGYNGQRHDFSSFRDFHRTFRAPHRYRAPSYRRPSGWYSHRWTFGEILPSLFWGRDYWLYEYEDYGLPSPPYGAMWVRVGNDALMIDEDSGEVITVAYDVFY